MHRFTPFVKPALVAAALALAAPVHALVTTDLVFITDPGPGPAFHTDADRITADARAYADSSMRGSASASIDLGTGVLKAKAVGEKKGFSEFSIAVDARADAVDTLTIDGPTDGQPVDVTFQLFVDGDLIVPTTATGGGTNAFATVQVRLGADGVSETAFLQRRNSYDPATGALLSTSLQGLGDFQGAQPVAGQPDHYELMLEMVAPVVPGTPFAFDTYLRAIVGSFGPIGSEAISDFSHTARLVVIVPQAYTVASESGVFLAGPAPVPEPRTWALLGVGAGLLALGAGRRRPRRA